MFSVFLTFCHTIMFMIVITFPKDKFFSLKNLHFKKPYLSFYLANSCVNNSDNYERSGAQQPDKLPLRNQIIKEVRDQQQFNSKMQKFASLSSPSQLRGQSTGLVNQGSRVQISPRAFSGRVPTGLFEQNSIW